MQRYNTTKDLKIQCYKEAQSLKLFYIINATQSKLPGGERMDWFFLFV